ncbi:MAG: thioredoxin fold domain-containing protein [Candidatus Marinimicrobia bacterium]|nr:thioredoxin fold domain-containing protein [Candidatus Neomarinimicrobiota bacterium]MBL7022963.1 thioredoxin fold domain-containing protein [Candidatus Neomarinimicrobiota bacterium]MBL7108781.1 thioredoxin fold domain-containing protein [Candidatus Neomarinimicrobiota bacterium]
MKNIFVIILLGLFWLSCGKEQSINWFPGSFQEALDKPEDQIIMIDFFTDWCVWCKNLDKDTFSHPAVIKLSKQFVNIKINAEVGAGVDIAKQYNVSGFPSIVFISKQGQEIDRIPGYLPPEQFVVRQQEILDGHNTIIDLQNRYARNPNDLEVAISLAEKHENSGKIKEASNIYHSVVEHYPNDSSEVVNSARYFVASESLLNGSTDGLFSFIEQHSSSQFIYNAYEQLVRYFGFIKDTTKEVKAFKDWISLYPNDASVLNGYAWRMSELEVNLEDALEKSRLAVVLANQNPKHQAQIIDTEAEILWKLGESEKAIDAIERAIAIEPENTYFQQQKEKFRQ